MEKRKNHGKECYINNGSDSDTASDSTPKKVFPKAEKPREKVLYKQAEQQQQPQRRTTTAQKTGKVDGKPWKPYANLNGKK